MIGSLFFLSLWCRDLCCAQFSSTQVANVYQSLGECHMTLKQYDHAAPAIEAALAAWRTFGKDPKIVEECLNLLVTARGMLRQVRCVV